MWSAYPRGPHVDPMLSPHCPHVVPMWSPCYPHVVSTSLWSPHCPHVVPMLSPLTHILTHPSTQPPIHLPKGRGVSTNYKSLNRIELSRLGPDLFDF